MWENDKPYYSDELVTIFHGDCLSLYSFWEHADILVSDPPYGMAFKSNMQGAFGKSEIENDNDTEARDAVLEKWGIRPALVFGRWSVPRPKGTKMVLTWEKGNHVGMGDLSLPWKPNTEEIYVLGAGFHGEGRKSSVLYHLAIAGMVGRADLGTRYHPTEKPLSLMRELVAACPPGIIVDPFMGSGTTLRAAKDLGRKAIGIELKEEYCAVAVKKLAQESLDFG